MIDRAHRRHFQIVVCAGLALVLCAGFVWHLAPQFEYGSNMQARPIPLLVAVLMGAGLVYLAGVFAMTRLPTYRRTLLLIGGAGLVMRAILIVSDPILEDDYYRYLWDGGVTAHGYNPYAFAPRDVFLDTGAPGVPDALRALALDADEIRNRVNHAELGTIYPPVAQGAFALAHAAKPWSPFAWRLTLLGFDAVAFFVLMGLLYELRRPMHWVGIYWWNPVLLMGTYNGAHMDIVIVPFALLALYFAIRNKTIRSGAALALAIGTKLWPVLLAPVLLRNIQSSARRKAVALGTGALLLGLMAWPVAAARQLGDRSGFVAYSGRWEMNDAFYMIVAGATSRVLRVLGDGVDSDVAARVVAAGLALGCALWLSRRPARDAADLCNRAALIVGALFLLGPTQFPWYYIWVVPFLALAPRGSLLVLSMMLPMYYLKFYYDARNDVDFFHYRLVWLEYAPTAVLLLWEWRRSAAARRASGSPTHA